VRALAFSGSRGPAGASIAQAAIAAGAPQVHLLLPSLLPAPLDIVVATPPPAFRQLTLT